MKLSHESPGALLTMPRDLIPVLIQGTRHHGLPPPVLFAPDAPAAKRVFEFLTAAIRMLFDWLAAGQVMPSNPASVVRGPKRSAKKGKTPVLSPEEARALPDAIDTSKPVGLRDRALVALLVYTFARVGAAVRMRGQDIYTQGCRTWLRLREKGGKRHEMHGYHCGDKYSDAIFPANREPGFAVRTIAGVYRLMRTALEQQA